MAESFAFERFVLDPSDRRLMLGGKPVELKGRYFDALALLVREQGRLVSKDHFLDEVWRGVPVTDEALTQCIRTLRRQLGDDAAEPRFIETVPKHGYRFIAPVRMAEDPAVPPNLGPGASASWNRLLLIGAAGTIGGGLSGFLGGLTYGFIGASQPFEPGMGAASVLLVILCLTVLVAVIGAAGVAFGIAAVVGTSQRLGARCIAGGALGGLLVGAAAKLLGLDAFSLLVGQSPGDITGAMEGLILGGAVGLAVWLSAGWRSRRRSAGLAALCGAAAGLVIPLLGGRLMLGSLDSLARHMPGSRLRLDHISHLLGEASFGPVTQYASSMLEGALFSACVVFAMQAARRSAPNDQG
jgi:DNA-binding winged helix-turn-helix (wHTH) protein